MKPWKKVPEAIRTDRTWAACFNGAAAGPPEGWAAERSLGENAEPT